MKRAGDEHAPAGDADAAGSGGAPSSVGAGAVGASDADAAADAVVVVRVVRTGGIAGLRREWRVEAGVDEATRWSALIEDCPWEGEAAVPASGADRFVWRIDARCADRPPRTAEVSDAALTGPWRALVEEVRSQGSAGPTPSPSPGASPR